MIHYHKWTHLQDLIVFTISSREHQQSPWMTAARRERSFQFEVVHLLSERKPAGWGVGGRILFLGKLACGCPSQLGSQFQRQPVWRPNSGSGASKQEGWGGGGGAAAAAEEVDFVRVARLLDNGNQSAGESATNQFDDGAVAATDEAGRWPSQGGSCGGHGGGDGAPTP